MSRRTRSISLLATLGLGLSACTSDPPTARRIAGASVASREEALTVMTRNLYFGADIGLLIAETDPYRVPVVGWELWQQVKESRPRDRLRAIAAEIAREKPDVVGLQEVALWRIQTPGDNVPGGAGTPATQVRYDFLALLLEELAELGERYDVAAADTTLDAELPTFPPSDQPFELTDVRLTDRDIILVRQGVKYQNGQSGVYAAYLPVAIGGKPLRVPRGWSTVDIKQRGTWLRFANTHLEIEQFGIVQEPQAAELRALLAASGLPTIVVGDLNSAADSHNTTSYSDFVGAGYVDAWPAATPGFTCCQVAALDNPLSVANERIDYVLGRGPFALSEARLTGVVPIDVGRSLWASDHFGVAARVTLQK